MIGTRWGRLIAGVGVAVGLTLVPVPADASAGDYKLDPGETLFANEGIGAVTSPYSSAVLIMQSDGNLVLYKETVFGSKSPCWATGTVGRGLKVRFGYDYVMRLYDRQNRVIRTWGAAGGTYVNVSQANGAVYVGFTKITGNCI